MEGPGVNAKPQGRGVGGPGMHAVGARGNAAGEGRDAVGRGSELGGWGARQARAFASADKASGLAWVPRLLASDSGLKSTR